MEVAPRYVQEQSRHKFTASLEVLIHGSIAAGQPVEAFDTSDSLSFADFVGRKETYALRVRGNSMVDDHICDGDMILVENTKEASDGQIVVAVVDGTESTLKADLPRAGKYDLPATCEWTMSPIRVPASQVEIGDDCSPSCGSIEGKGQAKAPVPHSRYACCRYACSARSQSCSWTRLKAAGFPVAISNFCNLIVSADGCDLRVLDNRNRRGGLAVLHTFHAGLRQLGYGTGRFSALWRAPGLRLRNLVRWSS